MSKLDLKQKIIVIFFLALPFVDLVTALTTRFGSTSITLGVIIKSIALVLSLIYVLFYSKCKYRKHTIFYLLVVCIFAAIYLLTKPDIWQLSSLITEATHAFKFLYFPIMMLCLYNIFHDFDIEADVIKRIILIDSLLFSALIIIPYFTNTGFPTYSVISFGTIGWFYAGNDISGILVILSICIFTLMDKQNKWKIFLIIPIIYAASIVGTKVSYMGIIASVTIAIFVYILKTKKQRFLLPTIVLVILIICSTNSLALWNMDKFDGLGELFTPSTEQNAGNTPSLEDNILTNENPQSVNEFISSNKVLSKINQITGKRLYLFLENYQYYAKAGLSTKLFGLGFAPRTAIEYKYMRRLVEIDILDIWIHYGIIGFAVYFAPFVFLAYQFIRNIKKICIESYAYIGAILLGFGISCIAGHVLGAPAVSIYLILLILLVIRQTEENYHD